MRPAPQATLASGRYRLQRRLGAGGMASVWLAVDERLERPVAIKIVADTLADDEQWVRRFRREAQAAAALSHRGVVPVFDYGVEDGRPFLVMEYIAGGTLGDRLASAGGSPPPDPQVVARELLEALAAVHAAGILHRDIKPANLLFDDNGHLRLTDFGIAQPQDSSTLTHTGVVLGTLRYLAPEVAGGAPASVQSDLYSAGVVIRELARMPAAPALAAVVAALTAEDPADRPASAGEALGLLDGDGRGAQGMAAGPAGPTAGAVTAATARLAAITAATRQLATTLRRPAVTGPGPSATAVTRRRRGPAGSGSGHGSSPADGLGGAIRRHGLSPKVASALLALVVVVIVVVLATSTGGPGGSPARSVPSPAPAQAPVSRQVQALDRIVQSAQR